MVQPIHGISNLKARNQPLASPPNQIGTIEFPINNLFDDDGIIAQSSYSDGSRRFFTVPNPRQFIFTTTFGF
jgi:hypothetical protein